MAKGLHDAGEESVLDVYFRGSSQPGAGEFSLRLCNSLVLRLKNWSGTFSDGETIAGDSSSDTGTLEKVENNGDGTKSLKLSDISESELFQLGEGVTGQYSGSTGTIDNANMTLESFTSGRFMLNEQIVGNSSGATADIVGVFGDEIAINNLSGSFTMGETINGQESGTSATLNNHYAGIPGLFDDDTTSGIIGEPGGGNGYSAISLDANNTDFPTLTKDLNDDYYVETKQVTYTASGGSIGPINAVVLTVDIGGSGEIALASAPLTGTPPSEVLTDQSSLNVKFAIVF